MSKTFPEKILRKPTKFSISVFPQLFLFYRVFRCFLAMGVQKHYKNVLQTKRFTKIQTDFFSIFVYHVFGRFSVRGVQKHDKKNLETKSDQPRYFFGPRGTNQPRQGPSLVFLSAPRFEFGCFIYIQERPGRLRAARTRAPGTPSRPAAFKPTAIGPSGPAKTKPTPPPPGAFTKPQTGPPIRRLPLLCVYVFFFF
jgi:hypothetical protein